jgi:ABC-2 type transport system permease protein
MPARRRTGFFQRLAALVRKEFSQIRRDRRLAASLVVPPTMQLLLFGFALDTTVSNLRLGIVDESRTPQSRELTAKMTESQSFRLAGMYLSPGDLGTAISRGQLDAGLVIPQDYARLLQRGRTADVQLLLNAVNANTATIAQGYAQGILQNYNRDLMQSGGLPVQIRPVSEGSGRPQIEPAFLFNPGLVTSWFIVTGTFGLLLILNASLISSAALTKEREAGTVEQLLMTPAGTTEIIIAKIAPLFILLLVTVAIAITLTRVVFQVPFRGSVWIVLLGSALCLLSGIGIGTLIATFSKSAQQSQLMSFFVNPPMASLSGSLTPKEAMPEWMQPLTALNPIYHFGEITRGALVKGASFDSLWPNLLALTIFTLVCLGVSVWRFRNQLG